MSDSTRFTQVSVRCVATILMLFLGGISTHGQQPGNYFDFQDSGVEGGQVKSTYRGKNVNIFVSGGYLSIRFTDDFKKAATINFRIYQKINQAEKSTNIPYNGVLYLKPGDEYFIDVFDVSSNTLVKKYIIQRQKLIPRIQFYDQKGLFYTSTGKVSDDKFSLMPGEKIRLKVDQRTGFSPMEVEYSLRNLKTKKTQQGTSKYAITDLQFEDNTDYELRVNYVLQRESIAVIYIRVKPYWYQSTITYGILLISLLAIGVVLLTSAFKKKINSSQKEQRKLEQAAIRLQSLLNPHFTFNALSSIQGLMNTNRIDEANQYLQEFSALLRQTLAKSQQMYTTLDQELEMMRLYLKLEAFRFNFSWDIEVSSALNPTEIEIPTLLLQPVIENAIKHGLSKLGDQGKLQIICTEGVKKGTFVLMVKDNGTWINKTDGYGLTLTSERIDTINKLNKTQQIALFFDKKSGTTAILTFHNWIDN